MPNTDPDPMISTAYPTRRKHAERWAELAREITADWQHVAAAAASGQPPEKPGELTIIGSGIELAGFVSADERLIHEADRVFYCVADPATCALINALRPDAYDLYVLYDDSKIRYHTYMQMAEAMLHCVRRGEHVLTIFYGHPGVFVLSTHRAVAIARREGHRALMRAGISAMDTMCADLGFDPSQPGLQTFEATDMLIRRRCPDTGVHVVLWQVGLIGELGYRRQGYLNSGFSVLLDYLEETYGPNQEIVNYIGSRYPGMDPLIDRVTIGGLRQPDAQARVTGISTFYIPPRDVAEVHEPTMVALGLMKPGQKPRKPTSPLRVIDEYGPREQAAVAGFQGFRVPIGYHWQEDTPGARFLLALQANSELRLRYIANPVSTLAAWPDPQMTDRDRELLAQREPGRAQVAAKGLRTRLPSASRRFFNRMMQHKGKAFDLARAVRSARPEDRAAAFRDWCKTRGTALEWDHLWEDFGVYLRQASFPWTGLYINKDMGLDLVFSPEPAGWNLAVWVDGVRIREPAYTRGALRWSEGNGNQTNGILNTDVTPYGRRRFTGLIWRAGTAPGASNRIVFREHKLPEVPLEVLTGAYRAEDDGREAEVVITPDLAAGRMRVMIDGAAAAGAKAIDANVLAWNGHRIVLAEKTVTHPDGIRLKGAYVTRFDGNGVLASTALNIAVNEDRVAVDGKIVSAQTRASGTTVWSDGPPSAPSGSFTPVLDPLSLSPLLIGRVQVSDRRLGVTGFAPVPPQARDALMQTPRWGVPADVWCGLVSVVTDPSSDRARAFWQNWFKAAKNHRRLRFAISEQAR